MCKLLEFSRFRFEQRRKEKEQRKKQVGEGGREAGAHTGVPCAVNGSRCCLARDRW